MTRPATGDTQPTEREYEVLELLADANPIKAIADALDISPRTVETHLANVATRLHAPKGKSPRVWLARWYWEYKGKKP